MAKAYEMELIFTASVGLRQINDFTKQCGFDEILLVKDALTVTIQQVLPRIPSEDYLKELAQVIKETYVTKQFNVTECRFTGYKYLREIEQEDEKE